MVEGGRGGLIIHHRGGVIGRCTVREASPTLRERLTEVSAWPPPLEECELGSTQMEEEEAARAERKDSLRLCAWERLGFMWTCMEGEGHRDIETERHNCNN
jgi:hypothetical protein